MTNPLKQLQAQGQSVWLDDIRRDLIEGGELARLITEDGLRGVTSNPAIFNKAIAETDLYDEALRALPDGSPKDWYEALAIADIQAACDAFAPVYEQTEGGDGFVSLEVSPRLAHDTPSTLAEARRLWARVDRPNVMIKVPATPAGLPAIETLIAEGINVNVTLIFSLAQYRTVCDAHLAGLKQRLAQGQPLAGVASVASVFVSRIDTLVDSLLDAAHQRGQIDEARLKRARGRLGIAHLKLAYQHYKATYHGPAFAALAEVGAAPQRPLWASTSTKDPAYPDVMYVEALIGPETVNTLPRETLEAFRDHGRVAPALERDLDTARTAFNEVAACGVDVDAVMAQLLKEGVEKFVKPFDALLGSVAAKRRAVAA